MEPPAAPCTRHNLHQPNTHKACRPAAPRHRTLSPHPRECNSIWNAKQLPTSIRRPDQGYSPRNFAALGKPRPLLADTQLSESARCTCTAWCFFQIIIWSLAGSRFSAMVSDWRSRALQAASAHASTPYASTPSAGLPRLQPGRRTGRLQMPTAPPLVPRPWEGRLLTYRWSSRQDGIKTK